MPIVEIKAFERRFDDQEAVEKLIAGVTDALCDVFGEEVRSETWVVVEGVSPKRWGFGGKLRI